MPLVNPSGKEPIWMSSTRHHPVTRNGITSLWRSMAPHPLALGVPLLLPRAFFIFRSKEKPPPRRPTCWSTVCMRGGGPRQSGETRRAGTSQRGVRQHERSTGAGGPYPSWPGPLAMPRLLGLADRIGRTISIAKLWSAGRERSARDGDPYQA